MDVRMYRIHGYLDLFSRIFFFKIFCEDLISRIFEWDKIREIRENFYPQKFVPLKYRMKAVTKRRLPFCKPNTHISSTSIKRVKLTLQQTQQTTYDVTN